jgi:hypothetical protein
MNVLIVNDYHVFESISLLDCGSVRIELLSSI